MEKIADARPRLKARIAGGLYLIVIAGGILAEIVVRERLTVAGDAAATARNILANQMLYRAGFAAEVGTCACNMPLAIIFYDLFKGVNRSLAWLVVFCTLVGTAVEAVSLLNHFAPLLLLQGGSYLSAFTTGQLQALAYMSLQLFTQGFSIALVFFGVYCLSLGYLILRSTFMPRVIGGLLAVEGLCYLINSYANFLAPGFATQFLAYLQISGVAEIALCLWLLVMGVNEQRWKEQASAA